MYGKNDCEEKPNNLATSIFCSQHIRNFTEMIKNGGRFCKLEGAASCTAGFGKPALQHRHLDSGMHSGVNQSREHNR